MRYFDLHCDTIGECLDRDLPLDGGGLHVDLACAGGIAPYVQCYAVWIPDELRGEAAFRRFCAAAGRLERETAESGGKLLRCRAGADLDRAERLGCPGAILTVENGSALAGKLEHVQDLKDQGVAMVTLTWNGENELGRGVLSPGNTGLSPFGRQAVAALEQAGVVVDVSHASPELFWDVERLAKRPFVASHSNAKEMCGHPRNLTKDQFLAIRDRGGLVGLNFFRSFLNDRPEEASREDILRHAEYFLALGGEDTLALGSDFDGARLPDDLPGLSGIPALWELFLQKGYPESLVEKIFYGNAARFFRRWAWGKESL